MIIYAFLHNGCIHESSYATISLHKTKIGAEKAMNKHKESAKKEFDKYRKRVEKDYRKQAKKEKLDDATLNMLIDSIGEYDRHQDWAVEPMEVLS